VVEEIASAGTGRAAADPSQPLGHKLPLHQELIAVPYRVSIGEQAAITIRPTIRPPQYDLVPRGESAQRRRSGVTRGFQSILDPDQRSNLDPGQADLASILEHESASIENLDGRAAGDLVRAADLFRLLRGLIACQCRRRAAHSQHSRKSDNQRCTPPTRHEPKPKAGMRRSCGGCGPKLPKKSAAKSGHQVCGCAWQPTPWPRRISARSGTASRPVFARAVESPLLGESAPRR
jgi:hypothetical protein